MRFMASAMASWASGDSAPSEMPAASKRLKIDSRGSTSSRLSGWAASLTLSRSRSMDTGRLSTSAVYSLNVA
ncbi:hypothetical protein D3C77_554220 [compost metagenome]